MLWVRCGVLVSTLSIPVFSVNSVCLFCYNGFMNKDFDSWNEAKKGLDSYDVFLPIKEGGVWWCSVGMNVGIEMCGKGWLFKII